MEDMIVRAFIAPHRRSRWLSSLGSAKRRPGFLDCLNHCRDLDPRYAYLMPSNADVFAILVSQGAPKNCHVISAIPVLDGRDMVLEDVVTEAELAGWGTLISCIPGRLGCYLDEAGSGRRLLLVRADVPAASKE